MDRNPQTASEEIFLKVLSFSASAPPLPLSFFCTFLQQSRFHNLGPLATQMSSPTTAWQICTISIHLVLARLGRLRRKAVPSAPVALQATFTLEVSLS